MVLSYNWMNPTMADVLSYGARKGLGVAVMNPMGGGNLAFDTPQILRLLKGAKTAAEVSLRYVLSTPGVTLAMSGMNTNEQVDENTAIVSRRAPMTPLQRKNMLKQLKEIQCLGTLVCAACGYCMPCPAGVDIPTNLKLLNQARLLGLQGYSRSLFGGLRNRPEGDHSALACKKCGKCLSKCPNDVNIIERLEETAELLSTS